MVKVVPVICARCGSSVREKNLRAWDGKPLLGLMAERVAGVLGRCVVLTDSPRYAEVAREYRAEVPYVDEKHGDLDDVTLALRRYVERTGARDAWLMLVQCTSPRLSEETLRRAQRLAGMLKQDEVLMTVAELECKATAVLGLGPDGRLVPAIPGLPLPSVPRQLLPRFYRFTGGITVVHGSRVAGVSLFEGCRMVPLVVPEVEGLDIDREEDFLKQ